MTYESFVQRVMAPSHGAGTSASERVREAFRALTPEAPLLHLRQCDKALRKAMANSQRHAWSSEHYKVRGLHRGPAEHVFSRADLLPYVGASLLDEVAPMLLDWHTVHFGRDTFTRAVQPLRPSIAARACWSIGRILLAAAQIRQHLGIRHVSAAPVDWLSRQLALLLIPWLDDVEATLACAPVEVDELWFAPCKVSKGAFRFRAPGVRSSGTAVAADGGASHVLEAVFRPARSQAAFASCVEALALSCDPLDVASARCLHQAGVTLADPVTVRAAAMDRCATDVWAAAALALFPSIETLALATKRFGAKTLVAREWSARHIASALESGLAPAVRIPVRATVRLLFDHDTITRTREVARRRLHRAE